MPRKDPDKQKEYLRQYYRKNKAKMDATRRLWSKKNRARELERQRQYRPVYYKNNREKYLQKFREYSEQLTDTYVSNAIRNIPRDKITPKLIKEKREQLIRYRERNPLMPKKIQISGFTIEEVEPKDVPARRNAYYGANKALYDFFDKTDRLNKPIKIKIAKNKAGYLMNRVRKLYPRFDVFWVDNFMWVQNNPFKEEHKLKTKQK